MSSSPAPATPWGAPFSPAGMVPDNGIRAGSGLSMTSERSMLEMEVQGQARVDKMEANRVRDKEELKSLIHSLYGESPQPTPQPSPSTEFKLITCSTNGTRDRTLLSTPPSISFSQVQTLAGWSNTAPPTNCSTSGPRVGSLLPTPLSIPLMNRAYDGSFNPSYFRPKPDLPNFTGKEVHGWLHRAEQFMDFYNISTDLRVRMAALYLEEGPLEWYQGNVRAKGKSLSWVEFEKGLVSMYDNSKAYKVFDEIPQPLPLMIRQLCDKVPQPPSRAPVTDVNSSMPNNSILDSTMENFTESEIAAENDVIGTKNTEVETEDAENDVAVTKDTIIGTENSINGIGNAIDGGNPAGPMEGNLTGAAETMQNQEEGSNEEAGDKSSGKNWPGSAVKVLDEMTDMFDNTLPADSSTSLNREPPTPLILLGQDASARVGQEPRSMHDFGNGVQGSKESAQKLGKVYAGSRSSAKAYRPQHEITVAEDVPHPFTTFLSDILIVVLRACLSAHTPIPVQSWPISWQNRDIVAVEETRSGKTLAYLTHGFVHLKRLQGDSKMGPRMLALSPTRELATQIHEEAVKFGRLSRIPSKCLCGDVPNGSQLGDITRGADIVIVAPRRLNDILERRRVSLHQVSYMVLDETDHMLDMSFEPQVNIGNIDKLGLMVKVEKLNTSLYDLLIDEPLMIIRAIGELVYDHLIAPNVKDSQCGPKGGDNEYSEVHLRRLLQILREFLDDAILSSYAIDDIWDDMKAMKDWKCIISMLLDENPLIELTEVDATNLVCRLHASAKKSNGEKIVPISDNRKLYYMEAKREALENNRREITTVMTKGNPKLLRRYVIDKAKVSSLVKIILHLRLEFFSLKRQEQNFKSIIGLITVASFKNVEKDTLGSCIAALSFCPIESQAVLQNSAQNKLMNIENVEKQTGEVRRILMERIAKPFYVTYVKISTDASIMEMVPPGALIMSGSENDLRNPVVNADIVRTTMVISLEWDLIFFGSTAESVADFFEIKVVKTVEPALKKQLIISTALMTLGIAPGSWLLPLSSLTIFNIGVRKQNEELGTIFFFVCCNGLVAGSVIVFVVEKFLDST